MAVELFRWQHRPPLLPLPVIGRIRRRAVPNFGDEIGPMVVRAILRERGLPAPEDATSHGRLLSVGSVFHLATAGDHVWGTGINAKRPASYAAPDSLTIHAVRGPRTRAKLMDLGYDVPEVFGDPGLLIREVPEIAVIDASKKTRKMALIPNFNDLKTYRGHPALVSPLQDPVTIAREIARSEFVVGSSLHAMVFADALGVDSRLIASENEPRFKYEDYYLGSGREAPEIVTSVEAATKLGAYEPATFDSRPLLEAFPDELFQK